MKLPQRPTLPLAFALLLPTVLLLAGCKGDNLTRIDTEAQEAKHLQQRVDELVADRQSESPAFSSVEEFASSWKKSTNISKNFVLKHEMRLQRGEISFEEMDAAAHRLLRKHQGKKIYNGLSGSISQFMLKNLPETGHAKAAAYYVRVLLGSSQVGLDFVSDVIAEQVRPAYPQEAKQLAERVLNRQAAIIQMARSNNLSENSVEDIMLSDEAIRDFKVLAGRQPQ